MAGHSTGLPYAPLYTRRMLHNIEAELSRNGEYIYLLTRGGQVIRRKNRYHGTATGDLQPGERVTGNAVIFGDERIFRRFCTLRMPDEFLSVGSTALLRNGPNRGIEETRELFRQILREYRASEDAAALKAMIQTRSGDYLVDKVIGFGLGSIGYTATNCLNPFVEHAAARVIADALKEVDASLNVRIIVQDPLYTSVCREVLTEFGIEMVEGFGAKAFTLVDDYSIVLCHHPNFPFREIIADMGRPALMCMEEERPFSAIFRNLRSDVPSVRSRAMMREYRKIPRPYAGPHAFYNNAWYHRVRQIHYDSIGGEVDYDAVDHQDICAGPDDGGEEGASIGLRQAALSELERNR